MRVLVRLFMLYDCLFGCSFDSEFDCYVWRACLCGGLRACLCVCCCLC